MKIIRDKGMSKLSITTFAMLGIEKCNEENCSEPPNTIIMLDHEPHGESFGLCEFHYQVRRELDDSLNFDD